jgi:hypothetical protein
MRVLTTEQKNRRRWYVKETGKPRSAVIYVVRVCMYMGMDRVSQLLARVAK